MAAPRSAATPSPSSTARSPSEGTSCRTSASSASTTSPSRKTAFESSSPATGLAASREKGPIGTSPRRHHRVNSFTPSSTKACPGMDTSCDFSEEMKSPNAQSAIALLADAAANGTITLMCICDDSEYCHRSLLKEMVLERRAALGRSHSSPPPGRSCGQ